jgi:hypothetical protein
MIHTAVVLPRALLERMKKDAERSEHGLSGEIRHRLMLSYGSETDRGDPQTIDLAERIKMLADSLAVDLRRKWHESSYAKAAFIGGIMALVGPTTLDRDIPGHTDDPEAVGRTHARLVRNPQRVASRGK